MRLKPGRSLSGKALRVNCSDEVLRVNKAPPAQKLEQYHDQADGLGFHFQGENVFALDLDEDAERGTQVGAFDDGSADPDVAEDVHAFEWVEEGAGTGIADHGVLGVAVAVVVAELVEVGDVFELAASVGRIHGDGPIAVRLVGGASGQADEKRGNVLAGGAVDEEKVARGPGLFHVTEGCDGGVGAGRARQSGEGVHSRRGDLDPRSGSRSSDVNLFGVDQQARAQDANGQNHYQPDNQANRWIRDGDAAAAGFGNAGDLRHFRFETFGLNGRRHRPFRGVDHWPRFALRRDGVGISAWERGGHPRE
jgi:hypothetical protein